MNMSKWGTLVSWRSITGLMSYAESIGVSAVKRKSASSNGKKYTFKTVGEVTSEQIDLLRTEASRLEVEAQKTVQELSASGYFKTGFN